MQKAFSLQPGEQQQLENIRAEQQRLLAQYGEATIVRREAKKALATAQDKQRNLLNSTVSRQGITNFIAARFEGNNLIVEIPDEPQAPKINGPAKGATDGMAVQK